MNINYENYKNIEELFKYSKSLQLAFDMYIYNKITFHKFNIILDNVVKKYNDKINNHY
jgi:hypothetical protein